MPLLTMLLILLFLMLLNPLLSFDSQTFPKITMSTIKLVFFFSFFLFLLNYYPYSWTMNLVSSWLTLNIPYINFSLQFNPNSLLFTSTAFFVSWNILEFSIWYMNKDWGFKTFLKYLLIFLVAMIIVVTANNFLTMYIGWEGVGLMSYLLIGWYHTREFASIGATQAILYNRVGDIGFLTAMCWTLENFNTLGFECAIHLNAFFTPVLIALVLAAASKSAMFIFHPWLPAAMEGPTPVSALLHSSTMVVAGIFLLIRISPLMSNNYIVLTLCTCLGALTTFYAATLALSQTDIKKIIAYSTSSQLGLMMVAIGISQPDLALFHICAHALFKAMLFLCAGVFTHVFKDEQDIRKMGGLHRFFPITTTCFSIGSFALMGTPFLSAFYSKDAIIEIINTSPVNSAALYLTLTATAFTVVYTIRLIYYMSFYYNRDLNTHSFVSEYSILPALIPIIRLTCGSIIGGSLMYFMFFPTNYSSHTLPEEIKMAAILITIGALMVASKLVMLAWNHSPYHLFDPHIFNPHLYNKVPHRWLTRNLLKYAEWCINFLTETLFLKSTAKRSADMQHTPIRNTFETESGKIKAYLSTLLVSIIIAAVISSIMYTMLKYYVM